MALRTTPSFAYMILLLALYFDLYSLTNGSESNSGENSDRSASVDCSKKLLCSNRTQSCHAIQVAETSKYSYKGEQTTFTASISLTSCQILGNLECYVDGCLNQRVHLDEGDEDELVLDCIVTTGQSTIEIVFRAFVQGSDMNDHDAVCSDKALLYTIRPPTAVTNITYQIDDCWGITVKWTHIFLNTTHFKVTVRRNGMKFFDIEARNSSIYLLASGWDRNGNYTIEVSALNPSGASDPSTLPIDLFNGTSFLHITNAYVKMDDNFAVLQFSIENCPLMQPPVVVAHYEGCTFDGNDKEIIHLSELIERNGTSSITLKRRLKLNNCGCVVELTAAEKLWKSFKYCTYDVQSVEILQKTPYVYVKCSYALDSQARGCCVKVETQNTSRSLKIARDGHSAYGKLGPLDNGTYTFAVSDWEKDTMECHFSQIVDQKNVTIGTTNDNIDPGRKDTTLTGGIIATIVVPVTLVIPAVVLVLAGIGYGLYQRYKQTGSLTVTNESGSQKGGQLDVGRPIVQPSKQTGSDQSGDKSVIGHPIVQPSKQTDQSGDKSGVGCPIVQPSKQTDQSGDKSSDNQNTGQPDNESGNQLDQPGDKPVAIQIDFESGNQLGNENLKENTSATMTESSLNTDNSAAPLLPHQEHPSIPLVVGAGTKVQKPPEGPLALLTVNNSFKNVDESELPTSSPFMETGEGPFTVATPTRPSRPTQQLQGTELRPVAASSPIRQEYAVYPPPSHQTFGKDLDENRWDDDSYLSGSCADSQSNT